MLLTIGSKTLFHLSKAVFEVEVARKFCPGFQLSPSKTAHGFFTLSPEKGYLPWVQDVCRKAGQLCSNDQFGHLTWIFTQFQPNPSYGLRNKLMAARNTQPSFCAITTENMASVKALNQVLAKPVYGIECIKKKFRMILQKATSQRLGLDAIFLM